jgi:phosphatidylserine/phosphatidylglycerophosphate/cardiolipin synthase-like enzyme
MARSLIVLPDDSATPLLDAIGTSAVSLRIKMFVFSDPSLLKAVIAARRRGVHVRVILNRARRSGQDDNSAARKTLKEAGVDVKHGHPAFAVTHEKSMVIDDAMALIQSCNWTTGNLTRTRDYAIRTTHGHDIADIVACFDADWRRRAFAPTRDAHVIWCPGPGRDRICRFIDNARHTLFVQNERYQDAVVIERLVRAARRGVKVHVLARPPHTLDRSKLVEGVGGLRILDDVGIKVHKLKHLKLHGKLILADGVAAIVGSINFAHGTFESRRELAIEVHDDDVVHRLHKIAKHDWKHSHPLDLSDAGLLADLDRKGDDVVAALALEPGKREQKPKKKR